MENQTSQDSFRAIQVTTRKIQINQNVHWGGRNHKAVDCLHKNSTCYRWKQTGHIPICCKSKKNVNFVSNQENSNEFVDADGCSKCGPF